MMSKITCALLNGQQAVGFIDRLLARSHQPKLNDLQSTIVLATWEGRTYRSIADRLSYDLDYIKQIAAKLWKLLSQLVGENICKSNIKSVLARCQESMLLVASGPESIADQRELMRLQSDSQADLTGSTCSEIALQMTETWMISDRMTTVAFLCAGENTKMPRSRQLDLQVQCEIESLIWQNLHQSITPNMLMNQLLSVLTVTNPAANSVNCLIVNCYL
jgi:hypothetical protein